MSEIIYNHPLLIIICAVILSYLGKYLWVSKDEEKTISKKFTDNIHDLELGMTARFGEYSEKMRIIQGEIMKDVDEKYFTKEMAERHDERITKMEEIINTILPRMEKIDIMYDLVREKNDK